MADSHSGSRRARRSRLRLRRRARAATFSTYYQVLGVSTTASQTEITRAYRRLAKRVHPDVSDQPHATEQFQLVAGAYRVLRDVDARRSYDAGLALAVIPRTTIWRRPLDPSRGLRVELSALFGAALLAAVSAACALAIP